MTTPATTDTDADARRAGAAGTTAAPASAPAQPAHPEGQPAGDRRLITTGLVLAMAVVALETTVVTTALPTIVGEFGRLDLYAWAFSAYLLTSTVTVPLYGKLADVYGRKRVFEIGMVLFLGGSILCGLAQGMTQLVLFRALQGLGAGAVMPTIFTLVADVYRLEERAKVQGAFSGLWGICSLAGPSAGAWLTVNLSWRAVFFAVVPFGLLALVVLGRVYHERVERRQVALDILGSALLIAGLTGLLLAMTQVGAQFGWGSIELLGSLGASAALLVGFVLAERRAADPVLPLGLFKQRVMAVSAVCNFLCGAILFGVTSYVPLFVQGVRGEGAAGAGVALTPMLVAWAMMGFFSPKLLLRYGFRTMAIGSSTLLVVGTTGLALTGADTPKLVLGASMLALGFGFGPSIAAFVMAVQESVPWNVRGVATSSTQLFRSLGGTIGVALLGALLQARLMANLAAEGLGEVNTSALLSPGGHGGALDLAPELVAQLQGALGDALRPTFFVMLALAAGTLLTVLVFARGVDLLRGGSARREARVASAEP